MRLRCFMVTLLISFIFCNEACGQFWRGGDRWDDDHRVLLMGKWSQLYYELNVGYNLSDYEYYANFLYFALGVGYPVNTDNAWRKFLPSQAIPDNEEEAELYGSMDTDDVYGGKVGIGFIHYFNHTIGFYAQASWGFLADFSSPSEDSSDSTTTDSEKETFIYNTVPVELGVCINVLGCLHVQGGLMYMWKEIPLLSVGVGVIF